MIELTTHKSIEGRSGKSALYQHLQSTFLPRLLLQSRKVVVALTVFRATEMMFFTPTTTGSAS